MAEDTRPITDMPKPLGHVHRFHLRGVAEGRSQVGVVIHDEPGYLDVGEGREPSVPIYEEGTVRSLVEEIASLQAQVDHWRTLAEEGTEPLLKSMKFENGQFDMAVTGPIMDVIAMGIVGQFKATGCVNYNELNLYDRDEPFQRYTVTVQKVGAMSPAEKAGIMTKRRDEALSAAEIGMEALDAMEEHSREDFGRLHDDDPMRERMATILSKLPEARRSIEDARDPEQIRTESRP